jgi:lambda repressor-like predicted transcriptional regulator
VNVEHSCARHPDPCRSCYVRCRCRCCRCAAANRLYERSRYRQRGGHPNHPMRVDAAPVRAHVRSVVEANGLSMAQLARAAGLPPSTVSFLMRSTGPRCEATTAAALLAVPVVPHDPADLARDGRNPACVDCGAVPLGGGLRCLPCFQRQADPRLSPSWHPSCGTPGGYQRHHRNNEKPCEPCKASRRVGEIAS